MLLGINCGLGPVQMKGILAYIMKAASVPVIVNPKRRTSEAKAERPVYDIDADRLPGP